MKCKKKWLLFLVLFILILLLACGNKKELAEKQYQKGLLLEKEGKFELAANAFNKATRLNPEHIPAHEKYVQIMRWELDQDEEVQADYQQKAKRNPDNPAYHYILASFADDTDEKMIEARTILDIDSLNYWGHILMARIYQEDNDPEASVLPLKKAIAIDPSKTTAFMNLGNAYFRLDSLELSNETYRHVIDIDSTSFGAYSAIWRNQLKQAHYDSTTGAKIDTQIAILSAKYNNDIDFLYPVCQMYLSIGQPDKANPYRQKILQNDSTGRYITLALQELWSIRDQKEQIAYCKKFIQDYPKSHYRKYAYGNGFYFLQRDSSTSWSTLRDWGEEWLSAFPKSADIYNTLAWDVYLKNDSTIDKAIEYAQQAVKLAKKRLLPYYKDTLGWAYFKKGMYAEALATLTEAFELYEEPDAEILFHIGAAYLKNNQIDKGLETMAVALVLNDNSEARKIFNQYYQEKFGTIDSAEDFIKKTVLGKSFMEPTPAPDFELISTNDDTIKLSQHSGKVALVAFFKPT